MSEYGESYGSWRAIVGENGEGARLLRDACYDNDVWLVVLTFPVLKGRG